MKYTSAAQKRRIDWNLGLTLTVMSWWTPHFLIHRELDSVASLTISALESLVKVYSPAVGRKIELEEPRLARGLDEKRIIMAKDHTVLVEALVQALGRDEAVKLGREALFAVGVKLGQETRERLGVGDSLREIVRAAKVLYKVLDISFSVEWHGEANATLIVNRCALSKNYSEVTCLVLSATDEGVVKGLNPKMDMTFEDRIANSCSKCTAKITLNTNRRIEK